jgi:branched-chain amino acid transport system permease protein
MGAQRDTTGRIAIAALVLLALLLPALVGDYRIFRWTIIIDYAIALLGLNMLTGYNGQISIGHGAFWAIGAYTTAILMATFGVPYWATVPIAGAVCCLFGFLFGLPALRLGGVYLALATFALAVVTPQLLKYKLIEGWTGGTNGIQLAKPDVPFGLPISQDQYLYYFTLAVALAMFWLARNLLHGRIGAAMIAVRDQPVAAAVLGINLAMLKSKTFGISALYTGVAGSLGAIITNYVSPDSFTFFLSITLLVGVVIGGIGTISGAIFGAIFVGMVPDLTADISKAAPTAIYGACLIACVYLMPAGVSGAVTAIRAWIARRTNNRLRGGANA